MASAYRGGVTSPTTDLHPPEARTVLRRGMTLLAEMIRTNPWPFAGALSGALVFSGASVAGAIVLGRVTDDLLVDPGEADPTVRAARAADMPTITAPATRAARTVG